MSEFYGEPEALPDDYGEDAGGDELGLVAKYFPESSPAPAESWAPEDEAPPSPAGAEMALLEEFRQQGFDAGAVEEVRDVDAEIASMSDDELDEELAAYDSEDDDDYYEGEEADAAGLIDLGTGQAATAEEWAASMERQGITPEMLVEAWAREHPNERLQQNWQHLQHLNDVHADMQDRQAAEQEQQLAPAESEARGLVADAFRVAGAGRVDVDTGLRAAVSVAETQIGAWQQAGYSPEQIDEMTTTGEFDRWCIETAAELGRQASISHYALGKV